MATARWQPPHLTSPRDPDNRVDTPPRPVFKSFSDRPPPPPPPAPGPRRPNPFPNVPGPLPPPPPLPGPSSFRLGPPLGVQGLSQPFAPPVEPPANLTVISILNDRKVMDEDACKEKLTLYRAFTYRKMTPSDPKMEKPSWAKVEISDENL